MKKVTAPSVYPRKRSPFWYVSYPTPDGKRKHEATRWRADDPTAYRKALDYARAKAQDAKADLEAGVSINWDSWVPGFLRTRYAESPLTLQRANNAWSALEPWLKERGLHTPRDPEYRHVQDYIDWRTAQTRPNKQKYSRNTAILELKFLGIAQREAMHRGWCNKVIFEKMGVKRSPAKEKPEITDEQDELIRRELKTMPEWMRDCYEIGMAQGCRISETKTPLADIDEVRGVITFDAKGSKRFATRLHSALVPLVKRKRKEGREFLCDLPRFAPKLWCQFFDRIGLPDHSFHCTRVTVITKMARAGVPIQQALAYVGHASELIHRIYQRLNPADLSLAEAAISVRPSGAKPGTAGGRKSTARRPRHGQTARR